MSRCGSLININPSAREMIKKCLLKVCFWLVPTRQFFNFMLLHLSRGADLYISMCNKMNIDPLGRPTVTAGRDHCLCTCRPSVPLFKI